MQFFLSSLAAQPPTLGLQLQGTSLQAALVGWRGSKVIIQELLTIDLSQPLKKWPPSTRIVTALAAEEVLVRPLKIQLLKEKDLAAALPYQAEPLLPYPLEDAILDKIVLGKSSEATQLTLICVRKEQLQAHLQRWHSIHIQPEVITTVPNALAAFSEYVAAEVPLHFCLYIGEEQTVCALIKEGKLIAVQTTAAGMTTLQRGYAEDIAQQNGAGASCLPFSQLDFANLDKTVYPQLSCACEHWEKQVMRILLALCKQERTESVPEVLCCGPGALLSHLPNAIFSQLQLSALSPTTPPNIPLEQLLSYALPIGMAVSQMAPYAATKIDLRQQEFAYPQRFKRYKKPLFAYVCLALLLAAALWLSYASYLSSQEQKLRADYLALLSVAHKDYAEQEKAIAERLSLSKRLPQGFVPPSIGSLTTAQLALRVALLEKELQTMPESFPLFAQVPTVSDLLAWLASHPLFHPPANTDASPEDSATLQIESLSYSLVKRPEQNRLQEHYQGKVELEFSSPSAKRARAFHDALIAPNDFVDEKSEVKWQASQGRYRASFFLKDKTVYPPTTAMRK